MCRLINAKLWLIYVQLKKLKKKKTHRISMRFRGVERIRTAVDGVADHCLATRPRHPLGWQI